MPAPVQCDQCGRSITDEEFRDGGAFRDRADILCAKCYKMYQKDERRREREKKLAKVETSVNKTRAAGRGSGRGVERRARGAHRRGTSRKTTGRKGAGRNPPESKSGLVGAFIAAAVVAFIIAVSVIYLLKKDGKTSREGTGPPGASAEALPPPPPPPPPPPSSTAQPVPEPSGAARKKPESEESEFGKSLFGPSGEVLRRKKQ
jgi:hypothetical protein